MMECKYKGNEKCFRNNVTLVEKLLTMNALKDLTTAIYLYGLYPTLKEKTQEDLPELYQFVQAATSNNVDMIDKEHIRKFRQIMDNNNYGWDTGGMYQLKVHFGSWISKENGASRSALSIMVLFWLISFRQNVLEKLDLKFVSEGKNYACITIITFVARDFSGSTGVKTQE